ncbi:MAG: MoaD/ThiS family protein [Planctomycetes bacterium]|nr:MoaD/ThiS family protein [Planctomycetota bacterium]
MPDVTANLYASFRKHCGGKASVTVPIQAPQTVAQLLDQLGVPVDEARIIFCDHRIVDVSHVLCGGETVGIFPAIGGG